MPMHLLNIDQRREETIRIIHGCCIQCNYLSKGNDGQTHQRICYRSYNVHKFMIICIYNKNRNSLCLSFLVILNKLFCRNSLALSVLYNQDYGKEGEEEERKRKGINLNKIIGQALIVLQILLLLLLHRKVPNINIHSFLEQ